MTDLRLHRREFFAAIAALAVSSTGKQAFALTDPLCVIVSASSKQRELRLPALRRIFMNQPTDDADGKRFIPINATPHTNERVAFDHAVLGMDADEVARYWIDQRIRGGQPPRTTSSAHVIVGVVARLPGAIAYVHKSQLTASVKALPIEGRLAGEPGYLLA